MRQQYLSSAERIVDAMLGESPALAQTAGDHTYDDRLPDWSPEAVAAHVSMLRDAADALSQVDTDALAARRRGGLHGAAGPRRAHALRADRGARARVEPAVPQPRRRCCTA